MIDYEGLQKHREQTLKDILELLKTENRVACIRPTGYGKSRFLIYPLCQKLPGKKLILEPNKEIMRYLSDLEWEKYNSEIITYQSIIHKDKDTLIERFKDVDYIILDEMHRALAKVWKEYLDYIFNSLENLKILGFTATEIRMDNRDVVEEIFNNVQIEPLYLADAILNGFLPIPDYHCSIYEITTKQLEKIKQIDTPIAKSILKYDIDKNVSEIFNNNLDLSKDHKIICFIDKIKNIAEATNNIKKWFKKDINIFEIHSKQSGFKNNKIINEFQNKKGINVILAINILNEGVHLDNIDTVIFLRKTRSNSIYYQQLGRVLDDNKDKEPKVFDLVNNADNLSNSYLKLFENVAKTSKIPVEELETKNGEKLKITTHQVDLINKLTKIQEEILKPKGKPWSEDEDNVLIENKDLKSKELQLLLPERTTTAINLRKSILGLTNQTRRDLDDDSLDKDIIRLKESGYTQPEICEELDISAHFLAYRIKINGLALDRKNWSKEEEKIFIKEYKQYLKGEITLSEIEISHGRQNGVLIKKARELGIYEIVDRSSNIKKDPNYNILYNYMKKIEDFRYSRADIFRNCNIENNDKNNKMLNLISNDLGRKFKVTNRSNEQEYIEYYNWTVELIKNEIYKNPTASVKEISENTRLSYDIVKNRISQEKLYPKEGYYNKDGKFVKKYYDISEKEKQYYYENKEKGYPYLSKKYGTPTYIIRRIIREKYPDFKLGNTPEDNARYREEIIEYSKNHSKSECKEKYSKDIICKYVREGIISFD